MREFRVILPDVRTSRPAHPVSQRKERNCANPAKASSTESQSHEAEPPPFHLQKHSVMGEMLLPLVRNSLRKKEKITFQILPRQEDFIGFLFLYFTLKCFSLWRKIAS